MVETLLTGTGAVRDYTDIRAEQLFEQYRKKFDLGALIAQARGSKSKDLLSLSDVLERHEIVDQWAAGCHSVAIDQIQGSDVPGRTQDFDGEFRPVHDRSKTRWTSVAAARARGTAMPPVHLTVVQGIDELEDVFFVSDGHHRISVACALGEDVIEAEITVIQVVALEPFTID